MIEDSDADMLMPAAATG